MQPPFDIGHGALISSEKAFGFGLFALVGLGASWAAAGGGGRSEDGGEVVFDGGEAVGVLDRGVCGLIGDVSDTSEMGVVAPCMSFDDVAMEVGKGCGNL